jgi:hypothetical protein
MRMITAGQLLLLLAGIGMMTVSHGADEDYLKALKEETQALTGAGSAPAAAAPAPAEAPKPQPAWSAAGQGLGEGLPPDLSHEQFEAALKSSYFGTFMFYAKLNATDRAAVYQAYKEDGQIAHIREKTTSLLKR